MPRVGSHVRDSRLRTTDAGSALLEGVAALAVAFLLLALIVQVAFVVVARNAAEAAVAASARRAARPGTDLGQEQASLAAVLAATVPGAHDLRVAVTSDGEQGRAEARFAWDPPGPDWLPIRIAVDAEVPVVAPP